MNKLLPKIIFYGLVIGIAVAGMVLYMKLQPAAMNNEQQAVNNPAVTAATCIITIDGQKYDVKPLRNTHTGGDIFICNTDMSDTFQKEHGDRLKMIQKYLMK